MTSQIVSPPTNDYRPEMDGLRSIAVLSVLIYHAEIILNGKTLLSGGYLGVDVFFVLSGYFITSVILRRLEKGTFSLRDFYIRRIKRLLPAISLVLLFSIACAWLFFLSPQLKSTAGSLLFTLGFTSNFLFAFEDSYIADPSKLKPLLHTWSLAVEEQFYFILPISLLISFKLGKRYLIFIAVLLVSLYSLKFAHTYSQLNPTFSFFLLPSRFWELGAGSLIAIGKLDKNNYSKILKTSMAIIGLLLVIVPMIKYNHDTLHPSGWTLIPIAGTAILVVFGRDNPLLKILLENRLMIGIGLISYSLYLWHWPILVFFTNHLGVITSPVALLLSVIAAYLSYRFWEKPLRYGSNKQAFLVVGLAYLILGISGFVFWKNSSEISRFSKIEKITQQFLEPEYRKLKQTPKGTNSLNRRTPICDMRNAETACRFGNEEFVTLGDSLVGSLDPTLKIRSGERGMISLSHQQCSFLDSSMWPNGTLPICSQANEDRMAFIKTLDTKKYLSFRRNIKGSQRQTMPWKIHWRRR